MFVICPKCDEPVTRAYKGVDEGRCPSCQEMVVMHECVACGVKYAAIRAGGPDVHDHHCDPRKISSIEGGRKAHANTGRRDPTYHERLAHAEAMEDWGDR